MKRTITRLLALAALTAAGATFHNFAAAAPAAPARNLQNLTILGQDYPRAFFFRASEGGARKRGADYDAWDAEFSRLMGIIGKCLDEEVLGTEASNPEFFSRFKQRHPQQVVLLHLNGNSRDPRYEAGHYFPGHWIYRKAVQIAANVPAEPGETVIHVEDARDFQVASGRYKTSNDDIGLFGITPDGKHDWKHCEQVQLVSVDAKANTIRVKRGCYGTQPLAFKAGQARAAAHQVEGPWGKTNHLLWFYNFSTHCPKDAQGRSCADLLVDDLAAWFGPGGKLAAFDGLEFDVMFNETRGDTDGDGEVDNGVVNGLNQYGIGMVEFARQLRSRMGENFIIQGDGALGPGGIRSQRAWGLLNGIESEGFPNLNEWNMEDWSGGLNRHNFWQANARPPVFNYINHKWNQPVPGRPGEHTNPDVPFARHRMSFAAAQFTDAMICYSLQPAKGNDGLIGIWDEFICGSDKKSGWLGKPQGPAVHLATATTDLMGGAANPATPLTRRIAGNVSVKDAGSEGVVISAKSNAADEVAFSIKEIPAQGEDFVVQVTMKAVPRQGYPKEMARFAQVTALGGSTSLLEVSPRDTGMAFRSQAETPIAAGSGARVHYRSAEKMGDQTLPAYAIHPPFLTGKGYVYWCRDVALPEQPELRFSLGMSEKSPERSDGVWFQVWLAELPDGKPGPFKQIFQGSTKAHAWIPCAMSLNAWAGKNVRLKFVADCGPHDNTVTDQGYWGDVRIVRAGEPDSAVTPPKTYMTWVNDRPFTSFFYYRNIKSKTLDLDFRIEGSESVTIQKITAHAHPDAMCRVFENGLVLANPSLKPHTFDLQALSPNRRYRRLQGTAGQDLETNNGAPVEGKVTLGERDALFLVRVP